MADLDPPVSVCWSVNIDNDRLGTFMTCDGLGVEVITEQREEGGNNGFVWQLPTRLKYSNIKLTRPVCADTREVIGWLSAITLRVTPQTATIKALTLDGKTIAQWNLLGVIPVRWTGPNLSTDGAKIATETIELAHHGFAPGGP